MSVSTNAPSVKDWQVDAVKFLPPRINKSGGKAISIISKQSNRVLAVPTPMMMTWGVADFKDANDVSDGKFKMSLVFPNESEATPATDAFLAKLIAFEALVVDAAVENSALWLGKKMNRELVMHTFKPFLKYPKDRDTKEVDMTRPPTMRPSVPCYDGQWNVEIFDTSMQAVFPSSDPSDERTPIDWVPSQSKVACVIQCGGVWATGMGWGVTWRVTQCVVKPRDVQSVYGVCQIELSDADRADIEGDAPAPAPEVKVAVPVAKPAAVPDTQVPDSDDEAEAAPVPVSAPKPKVVVKAKVPEPEPAEPEAAPKPKVVVEAEPEAAAEEEASEPDAAEEAAPAPKPKVMVKVKAKVPAEPAAEPSDPPKKKKVLVKAAPAV